MDSPRPSYSGLPEKADYDSEFTLDVELPSEDVGVEGQLYLSSPM
jgi:hypothetical protein